MLDHLVGLRVHIQLEEDGTDKPPSLPPGRIVRRLVGADRGDYYLVKLDFPVTCIRASTRKEWQLVDLVVATRFADDKLDRILSRRRKDAIPVGIANLLHPLSPDEPGFDLSKVDYFALGTIRRV